MRVREGPVGLRVEELRVLGYTEEGALCMEDLRCARKGETDQGNKP